MEAYDQEALGLDEILRLLERRGRRRATSAEPHEKPAKRHIGESFLAHADPATFRAGQVFHPGAFPAVLEDGGGNAWVALEPDLLTLVDHEAPAGTGEALSAGNVLAAFLLDHEVRAIVGDGYYSARIHWRVSELRSRLCKGGDWLGELPH